MTKPKRAHEAVPLAEPSRPDGEAPGPAAASPVPPPLPSLQEELRGAIAELANRLASIESRLQSISSDVPSKQAVEAFVRDTLAEYHARTQQTPKTSLLSDVLGLLKGAGLGGSGEPEDIYRATGKIVVDNIARKVARNVGKEMGLPEHSPVRFTLHPEEPKA